MTTQDRPRFSAAISELRYIFAGARRSLLGEKGGEPSLIGGLKGQEIRRRKTVAVIGTDPVERNQIVRQLRDANYSVLEAAKEVEALHLADEFDHNIDAVFVNDLRGDIDARNVAAAFMNSRPAARVLLSSSLDEVRCIESDSEETRSPGFRANPLIRALDRILGSR